MFWPEPVLLFKIVSKILSGHALLHVIDGVTISSFHVPSRRKISLQNQYKMPSRKSNFCNGLTLRICFFLGEWHIFNVCRYKLIVPCLDVFKATLDIFWDKSKLACHVLIMNVYIFLLLFKVDVYSREEF